MTKYLVETISMFRIRYVVETDVSGKVVTTLWDSGTVEFSQEHLDEIVSSIREIDNAEYVRLFDEGHPHLVHWNEEQKLRYVNKV